MTNIFGVLSASDRAMTRQLTEHQRENEMLVTFYDLASAMTFEQLTTAILRHLPNRTDLEAEAVHDFGNRLSRMADEMERRTEQ